MGVKTDLKPWRCGPIVFSWFDGVDGVEELRMFSKVLDSSANRADIAAVFIGV